jgi:hypothetical protein
MTSLWVGMCPMPFRDQGTMDNSPVQVQVQERYLF